MGTCKTTKIDSSIVGLAVAKENCPGLLANNKASTFTVGAASLVGEIAALSTDYNDYFKEATVRITIDLTSSTTVKMRISRTRGALTNAGVLDFAGGDPNWQVVNDGAVAARWDALVTPTADADVVAIVKLEDFVEDGDVFTVEVSDDDFVTSATQVLTVTSDGTGLVTWNELDVSEFGDIGADLTLTESNVINASRQRRKGNVSDIEAKVGYTTEITQSTFDNFLEGILFAAVHTKASYSKTLNVGEASLDVTGVVLSIQTTTTDFTTLELNVGEWIFVGGDAATARFDQGSGFARIVSIAANVLTIDRPGWANVISEAADPGKSIELYFGMFYRNEKDTSLIVPTSYQFEQTLGEDQIGTQSQYLKGQQCDQLTINFPSAETLTAEFQFIGMDSETRDGAEGLKDGTRVAAPTEDSYNSGDHIREMILYVYDSTVIKPDSVFGYVESGSVTVNNNLSPAKRIGRTGAYNVNAGTFEVGGELTANFTSVSAIQAIRDNADVGFNVIGAFNNEGWVIDIPLLSLSGGVPQIAENEPVKIALTKQGAENTNGYTISYTKFATLPDVAMVEVP